MFFLWNNVLLLYVLLQCLCRHKMMLLNFIFFQFFNAQWIYWCSSRSCLLSCMLMSFTFAQKINCKCSNCIYVLNYHLHKLYFFIICLFFCTFWKWWWMQQWPYNQLLNIQHSFFLCYFQFFFYFCSFQQLHFLLLPSSMLTHMHFLFLWYLM